ncbi:MAG: 50S ribosomal protein L13 [Tissierellia bacterium]|nr:50S ribosomal protein L13 [Tissierellia bacterium]
MTSFMANASNIERKWYLVDAEGKTLGRLASEIAMILNGKRKPTYTPHVDCGDYVVVINAEKIKITGGKGSEYTHIYHTGYPGGRREISFKDLMAKHPTWPIQLAVKGMMPKGKLGRQKLKKLKVYVGPEHPHTAQMPEKIEL